MLVLCLMAGCLTAAGQASPSITRARGESFTLEVRYAALPAVTLTALKWDIIFPAQLMDLEGDAPEAGPSALASGKTLQCNLIKPYLYTCLLFGGQKPLGDGAAALFHFKIRTTVDPVASKLRLQDADASTADLKRVTLKDAEASVTIQ